MDMARLFSFWGVLFLLLAGPLRGEDRRISPMDMYIIIDGSENLREKKDAALQWLCDSVVDTLLQGGDRLTVWIAGNTARVVYSEAVEGEESKGRIKTMLRAVNPGDGAADYAGALGQAAAAARRAGGMTYTLVISGQGGGPSSGGNTALNLLRYSRVLEFPGWRAQVVGLDVAPRAEQAAAAFMKR
jgi:hypothetical protein